jgi:HprK-related kinase B
MTATPPVNLKEFVQRVTEYGKAELCLPLRFGDYDLAIASNSGPMLEKLRHIYRHFLDDAPRSRFAITIIDVPAAPDLDLAFTRHLSDDSDDESKDEFCDLMDGRVIRKRSNGILFASGDGIELAIGPCEEHENKTVNFINSRYIQWQLHQGGVLAHAASVKGAKKGLVLAGNPSAGKTTLAFRLLDHGLSFVGKDRVIVRREARGLQGYGTPKPPRVNPGTAMSNPKLRPVLKAAYAQKLEKLSQEELWSVEKKHEVFIEELYGAGHAAMDGPIDAIVLLTWRRGPEPIRIERVSLNERRDLLTILMKKRGIFYRSPTGSVDPEPDEQAYLEVLGDSPVHEITGGLDFDQATRFCAGLL